jgi:hypothetical protein
MFENLTSAARSAITLDFWVGLYEDNWNRSVYHKVGLVLLAGFSVAAIFGAIFFAWRKAKHQTEEAA